MRFQIVAPPPADLSNGNRVTALRWARILRELGHGAVIQHEYKRRRADTLVALHAVKTASAVTAFAADHPEGQIVVGLTGTDIYPPGRNSSGRRPFQESIRRASHIIALQDHAAEALPEWARDKAWVIYQSAEAPASKPGKPRDRFQVAVIGHLRPVKDPFRAALAVRRLESESRIHVVQVGAALSDTMQEWAEKEADRNPRYRWVGAKSKYGAGRILGRSHLLVISSRSEGSANVLGEALVRDVPVLASRIGGLEATLGPDYPGYFPVGDTQALRELLLRAERDATFYRRLREGCRRVRSLVSPARERREWKRLIQSLTSASGRAKASLEAGTPRR